MSRTAFSDLMARLSQEFDDPATRGKPLSERTPVTTALETLLYDVIGAVKPDLFVEIGAFEAAFSRDMIGRYPDVPVLALEANPRVYEHFRDEVIGTGVRYLNAAADAAPGTVDFYVPEVIAGNKMPFVGRMGSLHEVGLRDSETTRLSVGAVRLDDLTREFDTARACLWIDVEGAVDRVLAGAADSLEKAAIVYCEIESSPVWKEQTLADSILDTLQGSGFVPVARDCQKWFQYNVLFLRQDIAETPALQAMAERYAAEALEVFRTGTTA